MAINDFYPFQDNQKVTAAMWNELLAAIRDGSFFLGGTAISDQVAGLSGRVAALEQKVAFLEDLKGRQFMRQQIALVPGQGVIDLTNPPILDTEQVYLNGMMMSKTILPNGFTGDYSINGSVITLAPYWSLQVEDGDVLVVIYQFEVNSHA